uniref:Proteophosphoglycan ppg4 n=1 Tax=Mycena chlorophos TaxID=658473 RepID=A0ABQ0LUA0_MYCCL|nr:predicted protein [Mycena chlorophos]
MPPSGPLSNRFHLGQAQALASGDEAHAEDHAKLLGESDPELERCQRELEEMKKQHAQTEARWAAELGRLEKELAVARADVARLVGANSEQISASLRALFNIQAHPDASVEHTPLFFGQASALLPSQPPTTNDELLLQGLMGAWAGLAGETEESVAQAHHSLGHAPAAQTTPREAKLSPHSVDSSTRIPALDVRTAVVMHALLVPARTGSSTRRKGKKRARSTLSTSPEAASATLNSRLFLPGSESPPATRPSSVAPSSNATSSIHGRARGSPTATIQGRDQRAPHPVVAPDPAGVAKTRERPFGTKHDAQADFNEQRAARMERKRAAAAAASSALGAEEEGNDNVRSSPAAITRLAAPSSAFVANVCAADRRHRRGQGKGKADEVFTAEVTAKRATEGRRRISDNPRPNKVTREH